MSLVSAISRIRPLDVIKSTAFKSLAFKLHSQSAVQDETQPKKPKKPFIPRITLISSDGLSVTTLEEAQKISKRRDLKLVKILDLDTKTQRPIYKLMTGSEYHAEDLKQREERKKEKENSNAFKGEKLLMLTSNITEHDLMTQVNKIIKWLAKRYEVRVAINIENSNSAKAENVFNLLSDKLSDAGRIVQKRQKGNDIKFQIMPPRKNTSNSNVDHS